MKTFALIPVALLVCAPLFAQAQPLAAHGPMTLTDVDKPLLEADRDYYFTNVAPAVDEAGEDRQVNGANAKVQSKQAQTERTRQQRSTGFPPAAKQLARREALATTSDISPRDTARKSGQANVQRARLLTLLVEFNPDAKDDFSGWERPNVDPANPA
ncbi:MAG: hypothetical protein ABWY56_02870, partial [Propionibacteriaceae bacterium]